MTSHLNTAVIIREGGPDTSQDEGAKFLLKNFINKFMVDRIEYLMFPSISAFDLIFKMFWFFAVSVRILIRIIP